MLQVVGKVLEIREEPYSAYTNRSGREVPAGLSRYAAVYEKGTLPTLVKVGEDLFPLIVDAEASGERLAIEVEVRVFGQNKHEVRALSVNPA